MLADLPKLPALRRLLVAVLAFMLVAFGTAHIRETILVRMQEEGVQRLYETEVHQPHLADTAMNDRRLVRARSTWVARVRPLAALAVPRPVRREFAAAPRAPPNAPRAPPSA